MFSLNCFNILLLLLCSQLNLCGSPFLERFLPIWLFSKYVTTEIVTFHLPGWCMLGVLLLPAFTCLGHECQDFWVSAIWNACVHNLDLGLHSHPKDLYGMESEPMLTPKEKSWMPLRGWTRDDVPHRIASPTHYQLRYSSPCFNTQISSSWKEKCKKMKPTGFGLHWPCEPKLWSRSLKKVWNGRSQWCL